MDAETMIEKLETIAYCCRERIADDEEEHDLLQIIAALRAQAKAEPVAVVDRERVAPWLADWMDSDSYRYMPTGTFLYTAPPPDHAEALAEALEKARSALWRVIEDNCGGQPEDYAEIRSIDAALTRYKERTNG